MGEVLPMQPEKGPDTMRGEIDTVLQDNPEITEQVHAATMDASKRKELEERQKEMSERAHADTKGFMNRSGINSALVGYAVSNDNSVLHTQPPLATEKPIELSEEDFHTFFGTNGKIRRHGVNDAVHSARDTSVLLKGPDGRIYTLYLQRESDTDFYPVHYMMGNQYEVKKADLESDTQKRRGFFARLFGKAS